MTAADYERRIRTYHGRPGRLGPAAQRAMTDLWPRWGLPIDDQPLTATRIFGRDIPVVLEPGAGMGEATAAMAADQPDVGIVAVEVHTAGVSRLLRRIDEAGLTNVRVVHGDAVAVLQRMVRPDGLAGIRLYFPDPWPKPRHHKRRFVRPDLVHLCATRLAPGGTFHAATDWVEYAERMLVVLGDEPLLVNTCEDFAPRPDWRPLTRFERKGLDKGHEVRDLIFRRVG